MDFNAMAKNNRKAKAKDTRTTQWFINNFVKCCVTAKDPKKMQRAHDKALEAGATPQDLEAALSES